jgi:hypothetical protein
MVNFTFHKKNIVHFVLSILERIFVGSRQANKTPLTPAIRTYRCQLPPEESESLELGLGSWDTFHTSQPLTMPEFLENGSVFAL